MYVKMYIVAIYYFVFQDPSQLSFISWADNPSRTQSPAPLSREYMKQTYSPAHDSNRVGSLWLQQNPLQSEAKVC